MKTTTKVTKSAKKTKSEADEVVYGDGFWFRMPRGLHHIMPTFIVNGEKIQKKLKGASHLLAAILSYDAYENKDRLSGDWIEFPSDRAEWDTGINRDTQHEHFKTLNECGLVEIRRSSNLGKREVKVNLAELVRLLKLVPPSPFYPCGEIPQATEPCGISPSRCGEIPQATIYIDRIDNTCGSFAEAPTEIPHTNSSTFGFDKSLPDKDEQPSTVQKNKPRYFAEKLYNFLFQRRKVMRKANLGQWTKDFAEILNNGFRTPEELDNIMEGYFRCFDCEYVPECYSAHSFCTKLAQIEKAIKRCEERGDIAEKPFFVDSTKSNTKKKRWACSEGYRKGADRCVNKKLVSADYILQEGEWEEFN